MIERYCVFGSSAMGCPFFAFFTEEDPASDGYLDMV